MQQPGLGTASVQRRGERGEGQVPVMDRADRPADDKSGEEVEDGGQIQLAAHAAWATPVVHDTYAGLRINMKCQVLDFHGQVIQGLHCGGESCSQHGQGRAITQGFIAGKEAALEKSST